MRYFVVKVAGRRAQLVFDGRVGCWGFYAIRIVEAASEARAINAAIESVRNDPELLALMAGGDARLPDFNATIDHEVASAPKPSDNEGFIFFEEDPT